MKLIWENATTRNMLVLCSPQEGTIGVVEQMPDHCEAGIRDLTKNIPVMQRIIKVATLEEAKQEVESTVKMHTSYKDAIIIDEPEVQIAIDGAALRNILASKTLEEAKDIARQVLADPRKWHKELLNGPV